MFTIFSKSSIFIIIWCKLYSNIYIYIYIYIWYFTMSCLLYRPYVFGTIRLQIIRLQIIGFGMNGFQMWRKVPNPTGVWCGTYTYWVWNLPSHSEPILSKPKTQLVYDAEPTPIGLGTFPHIWNPFIPNTMICNLMTRKQIVQN